MDESGLDPSELVVSRLALNKRACKSAWPAQPPSSQKEAEERLRKVEQTRKQAEERTRQTIAVKRALEHRFQKREYEKARITELQSALWDPTASRASRAQSSPMNEALPPSRSPASRAGTFVMGMVVGIWQGIAGSTSNDFRSNAPGLSAKLEAGLADVEAAARKADKARADAAALERANEEAGYAKREAAYRLSMSEVSLKREAEEREARERAKAQMEHTNALRASQASAMAAARQKRKQQAEERLASESKQREDEARRASSERHQLRQRRLAMDASRAKQAEVELAVEMIER